MFSRILLPVVKSWCLAALTPAAPHPLLYMNIAKRLRRCICTDTTLKRWGSRVRATSVSVRSGMLGHAAHAAVMPHPSKRGSTNYLIGLISEYKVWIGMSREFIPVPKPTQNSDVFLIFWNPLFQSRFGIGVLPSPTHVHGPFQCCCCVRDLRLFSAG